MYYDTIEQARLDGFRACQRCKPDDMAFFGQREELVVKVLELLQTRQSDATMTWSIKGLAEKVGVTPSYLCRVFKKTMGTTVGEYMRQFETPTSDATASSTLQSPDTSGNGTAGYTSDVDTSHSSTASGAGSTNTCATTFTTAGLPTADLSLLSDTTCLHPSTWSEEVPDLPDLSFDFEEWVWTEGLDFNDWMSFPETPNNELSI